MIAGVETDGLENALEPGSKHLGDGPAASEFDERKLTVRYLGRDACEHVVELRQIFWQGLAAPIDHGARAQAELCALDPGMREIGRVVLDRKISLPNHLSWI